MESSTDDFETDSEYMKEFNAGISMTRNFIRILVSSVDKLNLSFVSLCQVVKLNLETVL